MGGGGQSACRSSPCDPAAEAGLGGGVVVLAVESAMPRRLQICNPSGCGEGSQWEQWAAAAVM